MTWMAAGDPVHRERTWWDLVWEELTFLLGTQSRIKGVIMHHPHPQEQVDLLSFVFAVTLFKTDS